MADVKYSVKSMVTTTVDNREYLLVTLTIDCPVCGQIEMQLPGHHLRKVVELLHLQVMSNIALVSTSRAEEEVKELKELAAEILAVDPKETKH